MRIATTLPLEIDRAERPAGTVLEVSDADGQALIDDRRAVKLDADEAAPPTPTTPPIVPPLVPPLVIEEA